MRRIATALAAACFGLAAQVGALHAQETPRYNLPIDCTPGETCWVVNYVDEDAGPGARDYTCGPQTYDGHTGTDIAIGNLRAMQRGVAVLASAPGVVRATRDGVADRVLAGGEPEPAAVAGRECGNGVLIDHGAGWQTQYCHLRRGSVAVRKGDRVERGAPLGLVGLSGRTEFAHVHLTLRHRGTNVDPFTGRAAGSGCAPGGSPLWTKEAAAALAYRFASIYDGGLAGAPPGLAQVLAGEGIAPARREAPALVAWTAVFGLRAGDELALSLADPAGRVLIERRQRVERTQARRVELAGLRRAAAPWPAGRYRLEVRVLRPQSGGAPLAVQRTFDAEIE
jgi:hypothetical protein